MADYSIYTDRHIRNLAEANEEEQALIDMQVNQTAEAIASKYRSEPRFLGKVALALAEHVLKAKQ
jgi:hypothetical protein